jgi:hypothetical protein
LESFESFLHVLMHIIIFVSFNFIDHLFHWMSTGHGLVALIAFPGFHWSASVLSISTFFICIDDCSVRLMSVLSLQVDLPFCKHGLCMLSTCALVYHLSRLVCLLFSWFTECFSSYKLCTFWDTGLVFRWIFS